MYKWQLYNNYMINTVFVIDLLAVVLKIGLDMQIYFQKENITVTIEKWH